MTTVPIDVAEARDLGMRVLVTAGATAANAGHVMDVILAAETAGVTSHGLTWVPTFADQLAAGKIDGGAEPEVKRVAPAGLVVDARAGFAQAAIAAGIPHLVSLAGETAVAAMAVTGSGNCLLVGHYVERIAAEGLVAFAFVNSPKSMAPWGGTRPVFGTNPMAFACPRRDRPPMVLDFATSKVARSEIRLALQEGRDIPPDWALDPEGHPTTDPKAAMAGSVLPFGGHKGYGLALMVDLMAGALCDARFSSEAPAFLGDDPRPPGTGQFFVAIAPQAFGGAHFVDRVEELCAVLAEQPRGRAARGPAPRRTRPARGSAARRAAAAVRGAGAAIAGLLGLSRWIGRTTRPGAALRPGPSRPGSACRCRSGRRGARSRPR